MSVMTPTENRLRIAVERAGEIEYQSGNNRPKCHCRKCPSCRKRAWRHRRKRERQEGRR